MVLVDMHVAADPDELARLEIALLREHADQQRGGDDVVRHAEAEIAGALVQEARQPPVRDEILVGHVAGRQRHRVELGDVPAGEDQAARGRIGADILHQSRDLVDAAAARGGRALALVRRPARNAANRRHCAP